MAFPFILAVKWRHPSSLPHTLLLKRCKKVTENIISQNFPLSPPFQISCILCTNSCSSVAQKKCMNYNIFKNKLWTSYRCKGKWSIFPTTWIILLCYRSRTETAYEDKDNWVFVSGLTSKDKKKRLLKTAESTVLKTHSRTKKKRAKKITEPLKGKKKKRIQGEQLYTEERIKRMPTGGNLV